MYGQHEKLDQLLDGEQFTICFYDNMRTSKTVANDQELQDAYETANLGNRRVLKFFVDPFPESPLAQVWKLDSKTPKKTKGHSQTIEKKKDGEKYNWRKHVKELSVEDAQKKQLKKNIKKALMEKCLQIYDGLQGADTPEGAIDKAAKEIIENAMNEKGNEKTHHTKKAQIVSAPTEILQLKQGSNFEATIEVLNGFNKSYKNGNHFISLDCSTNVENLLEKVDIPINFEVLSKSTFKIAIPLKIDSESKVVEGKTYSAKFGFVN